jgi:hypothetical protein
MPTFVFAGAALPEELLLLQPVNPATSAAATPTNAAAVRGVVRIGQGSAQADHLSLWETPIFATG